MPVENVHAFRKKVDQSGELQREITASVSSGNIHEVVSLGKTHGFDFTEQDLKSVFGGFIANELSPAQLEAVVGGVSLIEPMSGFERTLLSSSVTLQLRSQC